MAMYNPLLDAFVCVADCGSFTKASEKLFISSTAVMKQMNQLEDQLNVRLLARTHHGVRLTRAGESVYKDAKFMIHYAQKALMNARSLSFNDEHSECYYTFCVGTSLLYPCNELVGLWNQVRERFPQYRIHLLPFEDSAIADVLAQMGTHYDFVIGPCRVGGWANACGFLQLDECAKGFAVPLGHRLAAHKTLTADDLHGETVMLARRGVSPCEDRVRDLFEREHPQIHIEDTHDTYNIEVFNRCERLGCVLSSLSCWQDVHPGLKTLTAQWAGYTPYGILYPQDAPADTLQVLEAMQRAALERRTA